MHFLEQRTTNNEQPTLPLGIISPQGKERHRARQSFTYIRMASLPAAGA
jgi:hypothetical protein